MIRKLFTRRLIQVAKVPKVPYRLFTTKNDDAGAAETFKQNMDQKMKKNTTLFEKLEEETFDR